MFDTFVRTVKNADFELIILILLVFLIIGSLYDIKTKEVPYFISVVPLMFLLFINLENKYWNNIKIAGIVFCVLVLYAYFSRNVGGADVLCFTNIALLMSLENFIIVLVIGIMSSLIYSLIRRKKSIAMYPFITLGYMCAIIKIYLL